MYIDEYLAMGTLDMDNLVALLNLNITFLIIFFLCSELFIEILIPLNVLVSVEQKPYIKIILPLILFCWHI